MSENPLEAIFKTFDKISQSVQTQLSKFAGFSNHSSPTNGRPLFSLASSFKADPLNASNDSILLPKLVPSEALSEQVESFCESPTPPFPLLHGKSATPITKEEVGRSTWIFLHTLAAQYPDNPTRQQRKDVKDLMEILSRMYPCKDRPASSLRLYDEIVLPR